MDSYGKTYYGQLNSNISPLILVGSIADIILGRNELSIFSKVGVYESIYNLSDNTQIYLEVIEP